MLPVGGFYFLYVPDKRYCLDHFVSESTVAEVIQGHTDRRTTHAVRSFVEHLAMRTHNNAALHWAGDHGNDPSGNRTAEIQAAVELHRTATGYVDVHAWYFTPDSFAEIMNTLYQCGLSQMKPVAIFPTLRDELEFFAVLKREA